MAHTVIDINPDRRIVDMSNTIHLLRPSESPLVVLLQRLAKETAYDVEFKWLEQGDIEMWDTVTSAVAESSGSHPTEIPVSNPDIFSPDDIVEIPSTGELVLVKGVTNEGSNKSITVTRGWADTTPADIANDAALHRIGDAQLDYSKSPDAKRVEPVTKSNYVQLFKTAVEGSGRLDAVKLYGGPDKNHQRKLKGIEHQVKLEKAFWFGEKASDISTGKQRTTTRGVLRWLANCPTKVNMQADGGTGELTQDEFDKGFLQDAFYYGSDTKYLFCSPLLLSVISGWAYGKLQVEQSQDTSSKTFGIRVGTYVSPHGIVKIIPHPLFKGEYGGYGVLLDMECLKYRPLNGRDTQLETNIQDPDLDGWKDMYMTDAGLEFRQVERHGLIYGITG